MKFRILTATVAALLVVMILGKEIIIPRIVAHKLERLVADNCVTCDLSIGRLSFSFFAPGTMTLSGVHLTSGIRGAIEIDATAEKILVDLRLWPLRRHKVEIENLWIGNPHVTLTDGDVKSQVKPSAGADSDYTFTLVKSQAEGGDFTYIRNTKGTSATLHIHKINVTAGAIGNTQLLIDEPGKIHAICQIENSGQVGLSIAALFFKKPLHVDVALHAEGQNLADLTAFFKANAGVNLTGVMVKADGEALVRDRHLSASVRAQYRGFDLKVDKMYDRSEVAAFFTNLGATIAMSKKNTGESKTQQTRTIETDREVGESIVSFILRGLKEAAIQVAEAVP